MKHKRFSVEQIVSVLKQAELGMPVAELTRQVGISDADVLSMEKGVLGHGVRSCARAQAIAG